MQLHKIKKKTTDRKEREETSIPIHSQETIEEQIESVQKQLKLKMPRVSLVGQAGRHPAEKRPEAKRKRVICRSDQVEIVSFQN